MEGSLKVTWCVVQVSGVRAVNGRRTRTKVDHPPSSPSSSPASISQNQTRYNFTSPPSKLVQHRVMADTSVPSASAPRSSLHNNAPGSRESLVEPPSPALSSSSRTHSIRRKPVPQAPNPIDTSRETTPYAEGNETLASSNEQQDAPRNGMLSSGVLSLPGQGTPLHELPPSPSNSHLHAFPPQPRNGTATPSPTLPAAASAAPFSYHSSAPLAMSAAARAPSSIASHDLPPPETNPAAFRSGLNSRPSVHSHRSSVAAESIYGTAQVGVIGKNKPREVIRIERDYSGGELCQFWSGWIWELEGRVSCDGRECMLCGEDELTNDGCNRLPLPSSKTLSTSSTRSWHPLTTLTSRALTTAWRLSPSTSAHRSSEVITSG